MKSKFSLFFFLVFIFFINTCLAQNKGVKVEENPSRAKNERICYKKVALLIGNNKYLEPQYFLKNTKNDVSDVGNALKGLGFEVTILTDLPKKSFENSILEYTKKLTEAEIGFFYYSGHGFEENGENYMVPSDAGLNSQNADFTCVDLNFLFTNLEKAGNENNIIVLDACRSNLQSNDKKIKLKGFTTPNPPNGTLVVYGTKIGKTAIENQSSRNGAFTESLLKFLPNKELGIRQVIDKTFDDMNIRTNGKQLPSRFDLMPKDYKLIHTPFKVSNLKKLVYRKLITDAFELMPKTNVNDLNSDNTKKLIELFKKANENIPEDTLSSWWAGNLLQVSNTKESIFYFEKAISNGAYWYYNYYSVATQSKRIGNLSNSRKYLTIGLEKYPNNEDLIREYIEVLVEADEIEKAIRFSQTVIKEKRYTNDYDFRLISKWIFAEYGENSSKSIEFRKKAEQWSNEIPFYKIN